MISTNERRQEPSGIEPGWCDVIDLLAVSDDGDTAIATQFGMYPWAATSALQICVWFPQSPPIVLAESELRIPDRLWEVRGSGLWVEHVCETPLEHWSYGLEAFALEIDDPAELLKRGHGTRVPLGWELEFEAASPASDLAATDSVKERELQTGSGAYRQGGGVHGLLLTKSGEIEFTGTGSRSHRWGSDAVIGNSRHLQSGEATEQADTGRTAIALPGPGHVMFASFQPGHIPESKCETVEP